MSCSQFEKFSNRLVCAVVLLCVACSSPTIRDETDGVEQPEDSSVTCGDAHRLLLEGAYAQAAEALRLQMAEDSDFAGEPATDLCLGRALLGTREYEEAFRLFSGLVGLRHSDDNLSEQACLYQLWATTPPDGVDGVLQPCLTHHPSQIPVLLFEVDRIPLTVSLFELAAREQRLQDAVSIADWMLTSQDSLDATTKGWMLHRLLDLARHAGPVQLQQLSQEASDLAELVWLFAQHWAAVEEQRWDWLEENLAVLREHLIELDAEAYADAIELAMTGRDEPRAAVFGCTLDLSGPGRPASRAALAGFLLAQGAFDPDAVQQSRLIIVDVGEAGQAPADAVAELDQQGVLAIIGPLDDELAGDVLTAAETLGIPTISLAPNSAVADPQWTFLLAPSAVAEAEALVQFVVDEGLLDIAVAMPIPVPPYMEQLVDEFVDYATAYGIRVIEPVVYQVDNLQAEMQDAAETLADHHFDGLLIADTASNATTLAAYLGVEDIWARSPGQSPSGPRRYVLYLGNSFWNNPEFLQSGPDYLAGGVFPAWMSDVTGHERGVDFIDRFTDVFGRRPGVLDSFAHDALASLRQITLESAARTRESVREVLLNGLFPDLAVGDLSFGSDHIHDHTPVLLQVTSTGFEPL